MTEQLIRMYVNVGINKNDRASSVKVYCSNSGNCPFKEMSGCIHSNFTRCVYGKTVKQEGFTKRASKYRTWLDEQCNQQHKLEKTIKIKSISAKKYERIGDYVFLPYSYMNMNNDVSFIEHNGGFFSWSNKPFIKKEDWTLDTIKKIISFQPRTLFDNREIIQYRKEIVPLFVSHLKEQDNDLYLQLVNEFSEFDIKDDQTSKVGRMAFLHTLAEGKVKIGKEVWYWDGVSKLTSTMMMPLVLMGINKESMTTTVQISENIIVEVTSDDQVLDTTRFVS